MSVTISTDAAPDEINISNGNFTRIMAVLGYDDDDLEWSGEFRGDALRDLRGRIEFVLAGIAAMPDLDGGLATVDHTNPGGCRFISCGLRAGYFTERLTALDALAQIALDRDSAVVWG